MRALGVLALVAALLTGGCDVDDGGPPAPAPSPSEEPAGEVVDRSVDLEAIEAQHDVRLGVYALDTGTGNRIEHRADERFAFASTFKALLVGVVLEQHGPDVLDDPVAIARDDIAGHSPQVEAALEAGRTTMTVGELADATVRFSDNAAGNLLLDLIGGPAGLQDSLRAIGDDVTNATRGEPELNEAVPGDERDTSSPRALATSSQHYTIGEAEATTRDLLVDLMLRNTTGDAVIRAGVPEGWQVADKTGSASYGTRNDIAIVWPPEGEPIVVAIMTSRDEQDADRVDAAIADAMSVVAETFG